jgi:hypothetical protein
MVTKHGDLVARRVLEGGIPARKHVTFPRSKARVIPEAKTGTRIVLAPPAAPAITGNGSLDIACGGCGAVLVKSAPECLAMREIIVRCPYCNQCNDIDRLIARSESS